MMTPLQKITTRYPGGLGRGKKTASGISYQVSCPTRQDHNPSLTITEKPNRDVLLYDHGGDAPESVVAVWGLTIADLFVGDGKATKNGKPRWDIFKDGKCVSTDVYQWEDGREEFQKMRYEPKQGHPLHCVKGEKEFLFKHYDPGHPKAKKNGYVWNLDDCTRILFNLPKVKLAREAGGIILVVEGEKDVHTTEQVYGLTATTPPTGAGSWDAELHPPFLKGAHVVVIPDNDSAGRLQAKAAALSLVGTAASVKLLPPLGEKPKYDLTDFVRDGGTLEDLGAIIDATPVLTDEDVAGAGGTGSQKPNIFVVKSLNEWLDDASVQTVPLRLFGDLWFQNEVCVLFAETNVGKSILAVQIGEALASGNSTLYGFDVEALAGKVLYIDFELSAQQFFGRYSDDQGRPFRFHPDLTRAVVDVDFDFDEGWAEAIDHSIEDLIKEHKPLYVIVDNITFLKDEQEKAKGAVPLMRRLKSLQGRYDISLLALAHTPKRDQSRPLNKSDLGGSRHILNFVDSCFALGESHRDIGTRYAKQIKCRAVDFTLDTGNVAVLSLDKRDGFLRFGFETFGPETEHLRARSSAENTELSTDILMLKDSDPHISNREIGRRLGTSHVQVGRVINKEKERKAEEAAKGGTSVPLVEQGGTGVPVFHHSNYSGNATLPESGTVEQVFQGVPPVPVSDGVVIKSEPGPWDSYPADGGGL